jgi:hypothetical protein
MERITSFYRSDARYKSLRIIGTLFTLIGAALLAMGALLLAFGLYILLSYPPGEPPGGAGPFAPRHGIVVPLGAGPSGALCLLWSFGLSLAGLQLVATGTLFRLLIQLEENTRASAQSLDKIRMRLESGREGVEPFFRA